MRKRVMLDLHALPSTPAGLHALTSSHGRVVKPRLSPEGTPLLLASSYRLTQTDSGEAYPLLDAENSRCPFGVARSENI